MQRKSLDTLKNTLIKLDFERDWIPEFIHYIKQIIEKGATLIVLFGSRAKGEFLKDSDIDILIVSTNLRDDMSERVLDFFSDKLPVQPFVVTPLELKQRIEKMDFLIFDAFEDGVVLFSIMDLDQIHNLLSMSKERFRLKRVKNGWRFDVAVAEAAGI